MCYTPLQQVRGSYSSTSIQTLAELGMGLFLDKHISSLKAACWVRIFLSRHSVCTQLMASL